MRVGLLSDSHGRAARTRDAVRLLVGRGADILLHMGDIETEEVLDQLAGLTAHVVFGNNDDEISLGRYAASIGLTVAHPLGQLSVDGKTIAFTHGHLGSSLRDWRGIDYFVHGHTHQRRDERREGTRIINPGALHRAPVYSVALLDPASDALEFLDLGE
ncbi:MAG: YfcE family phosphodiesterase [Phycisphaeraceae bacterium]|nr:YfcE family phosphodiesterase [Phycisphaeraceae bacterium]